MKKLIFILIIALSMTGTVTAGDAIITNPNPVRGDLLSADTCNMPDDPVLFQQQPMDCDGSWALVTSDTDFGYFVYDDYDIYYNPISDIHFWGCDLRYDSTGWSECDEEPLTFNIHFCRDNGSGAPDEANPAHVYTVTLAHDPNAVCVLSGGYQVWEWYSYLDPLCHNYSGWVGIQGVGNGDSCVFMWYNSDQTFGYNSWQDGGYTDYQQAFCLTGLP